MTYVPKTPAEWDEEFSERAAMMEFCGDRSRKEAEAFARKLLGPRPEAKDKP